MEKISVVTPIYNERGNLEELVQRLQDVFSTLQKPYEIIAVDDGSKDGSFELLEKLAKKDVHLKVISFQTNKGQTAALSAGIERATGDIIVTMDSDLENDPADIPQLLLKLDEGFDVVSGWRRTRWQGKFLTRKLPSILANKLISRITRLPLHDFGCILKAYRREVIEDVKLYGEMHRFIPAHASWHGARVTEIPVSFSPRRYGVSKYGFSRTFRVLLDLVLLRFLDRYFTKPMHFFGGIGSISLLLGTLTATLAVVLKIIDVRDFVETPLPIFSALLLIVGIQLIVMGILAEMQMRTYFESQGKRPYRVMREINF